MHAHFRKTVYLNNTMMMAYVASVFLALLGSALAGQQPQNDVCPHFSITDSQSNKCYQILPLTPSPYFDGPALCGENGGTLSTDVLDCDGNNESRMCDVVKSLCQVQQALFLCNICVVFLCQSVCHLEICILSTP